MMLFNTLIILIA